MISRRDFLAIFTSTLLTGCGFRLRGTGDPIGRLPDALKIRAVDPFAPMIKSIKRQLIDQGCNVVQSDQVSTLTVSAIQSSERILGPVSGGDQTEIVLEISYDLVSADLVTIIPQTSVRASLVYVDAGSDSSAEEGRVTQLKRGLENDLLQQIVPSIRIRYDQALKQTTSTQ